MGLTKYRQIARRHIDNVTAAQRPSNESIFSTADLESLKSMGFLQLLEDLGTTNHSTHENMSRVEMHEDIVILNQYLREDKHLKDQRPSTRTAIKARDFIAQAILPGSDFAEKSPYDDDETSTLTPDEIAKFHGMSSDGLKLLSNLCSLYPIPSDLNSEDIAAIQCAALFTEASDPWTCSSSRATALEILNSFVSSRDSKSLSTALSDLLREHIKPAFAAGRRNPAITPQGRKVMYDPPSTDAPTVVAGESEKAASLWKYRNVYIVTVLQWVVHSLNLVESTSIHHLYPYVTPPLLTLIDSPTTATKVKGLNLLTHLLSLTPSTLLSQTGLGSVFEQTLLPYLAHLSPLTSEKESLQLQNAVYPAIISLARARYAHPRDRELQQEALGTVMREGILAGYAQAGEHVRIADLLTKEMGLLVEGMGMGWVYHLKRLLPLLSANLSGPFALTYPPLILSTLETLQTIIVIAWPRIPHYRFEILKGLTVCWCRIADEEKDGGETGEELKDVRLGIQKTVKMLTATLKQGRLDVQGEYGKIVEEGDERLVGLLKA